MTRIVEIDVKGLKTAVNAILDHLIDDLGIEKLKIEQDYYWNCPAAELYDVTKTPIGYREPSR